MTITRDIPHRCPVCDAKSKKCAACKGAGVLWGKETVVIEPSAPTCYPSILPSTQPWPFVLPGITWTCGTSAAPSGQVYGTT